MAFINHYKDAYLFFLSQWSILKKYVHPLALLPLTSLRILPQWLNIPSINHFSPLRCIFGNLCLQSFSPMFPFFLLSHSPISLPVPHIQCHSLITHSTTSTTQTSYLSSYQPSFLLPTYMLFSPYSPFLSVSSSSLPDSYMTIHPYILPARYMETQIWQVPICEVIKDPSMHYKTFLWLI